MKIKIPKKLRKLLLWAALLGAVFIFSVFVFFLKDLPSPTILTSSSTPQSIQILDRNQKLLYTIYSNRNQTFVPLSSIPEHMQEATIAIEDKDFYRHGAIDLRGISRALFSIIFKDQLQGGSTITQQLVKNSLLTPERTITRKVKEIIVAFATEAIYPKDKILEMYLNQSPYGGTSWGVEAAALTYFGKHAKNLTLAESALLAGLPEAPTLNSPFGAHPQYAKARQVETLHKMHEQGYISKEQRDKAIKEPLRFEGSNDILAPHFVLYIKDLLTKKYGEKRIGQGGLKITTSLDLDIQNTAQATVSAEIGKIQRFRVKNGAALVTNPKTGEILAMVGSKDYFDTDIDGNVNITLAHRQPGSSIKPINYALGLMKGYTAATPFIDQKVCFPNITSPPYCPVNYDGQFHGLVQMRYALGSSMNIPAVKMLKLNGVDNMINLATQMGISTFKSSDDYGLSLTLGGGEVTMVDMAEAFGVFANGGYRIDLQPILKVTDRNGKVLEEYSLPPSPIFGKKVIPEGVAFIISDILADNNARLAAFGPNSALNIRNQIVSVKTGTTNDFRDNWTIGYTPDVVVATWVGNNDNSPMSGLVSGVTGAAPIWRGIITELLKNKPPHPPQKPADIIQKKICSVSGLLPTSQCETRFEYFIKGTEPAKFDPGVRKVFIDKTTGGFAKPGQTENVEEKDQWVVPDATGENYCITCPVPSPSPSSQPTP